MCSPSRAGSRRMVSARMFLRIQSVVEEVDPAGVPEAIFPVSAG